MKWIKLVSWHFWGVLACIRQFAKPLSLLQMLLLQNVNMSHGFVGDGSIKKNTNIKINRKMFQKTPPTPCMWWAFNYSLLWDFTDCTYTLPGIDWAETIPNAERIVNKLFHGESAIEECHRCRKEFFSSNFMHRSKSIIIIIYDQYLSHIDSFTSVSRIETRRVKSAPNNQPN